MFLVSFKRLRQSEWTWKLFNKLNEFKLLGPKKWNITPKMRFFFVLRSLWRFITLIGLVVADNDFGETTILGPTSSSSFSCMLWPLEEEKKGFVLLFVLFCFAFYSFQKERKKPYTLNAWTALKRKKKNLRDGADK